MSALIVIECNACALTTAPFPSAVMAREQAADAGWAVTAPAADDVDYCPKCSGPATLPSGAKVFGDPVSRLELARAGIVQLRDALAGITAMVDYRPFVVVSVANLARTRADQLLAELAS